jgi:hypothetical protein
MKKITTSISLEPHIYFKIKEEEINMSQLINAFFEDYFIETEEDLQLKELEEQRQIIINNIKKEQAQELKLASQIAKAKNKIKEEEKIRDIKSTAHIQSLKANNPLRFL